MNYVIDYETLPNFILLVAEETRTTKQEVFEISMWKNQTGDLYKFLQQSESSARAPNDGVHVGYNSQKFDQQISEFILENGRRLMQLSSEESAHSIYLFVQNIIELSNLNQFMPYAPWNFRIKCIDLYKLNGWDNQNKKSSLKWIQNTMRWNDIVEMAVPHDTLIRDRDVADEMIRYCKNDVRSTKAIYLRSAEEVRMRQNLSNIYGIDMLSHSRTTVGKDIFLSKIREVTGKSRSEMKSMGTHRDVVELKYVILPQMKFQTPECIGALKMFQSKKVNPLYMKNAFTHTLKWRGLTVKYGVGGIHGKAKPGHYKSGNGMVILSCDVSSYYPNLTIRNRWSPAHLPTEVYCDQYEWFYNERKKIPKTNDLNKAYKELLNAAGFGLTNEKHSPLYDPLHFLRVTVNGQLGLTLLTEMLCLAMPTAKPIMINTDGIEIMVDEKDIPVYEKTCKDWEKVMKLELEHSRYSDIFFTDGNNYIAVKEEKEVSKDKWESMCKDSPHDIYVERDGKFYVKETKCKGRFEFHKLELHKDSSFLVVRKAVFQFFVHGMDPLLYLPTNHDIFDWCSGKRVKGAWRFEAHGLVNGYPVVEKLQKVIRYYVSRSGYRLRKQNTAVPTKYLELHADKKKTKAYQRLYNTHNPDIAWEDRGVDQHWYHTEIQKEIMSVLGKGIIEMKF